MLTALGGGTVWVLLGSWIVPATVTVIVVTYLLFTRVLPSRQEPAPGSDGKAFRRFLAGESTAMVLDQIGVTLLPVLVVVILGSETGAAFGIAWMMTTALDALVIGMGSSLVVEGSQPGADVRSMHRALRRRCLIGLGGVVVVAELAAPLLLHAFGSQYAADSTTVFRLLVLASLPRALIILGMCAARAQRRIGWVVRVHLGLAVLVPGGAVLLCHTVGLAGAGLAWAGAHLIVAAGILVDEARGRAAASAPAPAATGLAPGPPFDAEATMVIVRSTPLTSVLFPRHAGLVDANPTVILPRIRPRQPDGTRPRPSPSDGSRPRQPGGSRSPSAPTSFGEPRRRQEHATRGNPRDDAQRRRT
jgi:hypothetical protein